MGRVWGLVRKYAKGYGKMYFAGMILGTIGQLVALGQPKYGGDLIQAVQDGRSLVMPVLILSILIVFSAVISVLQQIIIAKIGETTVSSVRSNLVRRFLNLPLLSQESKAPGWYSQRITNDASLVKSLTGQTIAFAQAFVLLIGSGLAMTLIDMPAFVIGISLAAVSFAFTLIASRPIKAWQIKIQEALMHLTINVQEVASAGRMLKAYDAMECMRKKLDADVRSAYDAGYRLATLSSFFAPVAQILMQVANIGTILFGAYQVAAGSLQFAQLIVFLMYFNFFSSAVSQIAGSYAQMQSADAGDKRIQELECEQEEERFSSWQNESLPMSPQIQFQNVSFTYPSAKAEVIHDITFTAPAGRRTAIVGASGGGKTTCLGMLEKYYSPQKGRVTIAGKDIRMIPDDVLHAAIGYIDQSSVTLTGSIRDNLDPKQSGYADTSMRDALIQVGLDSIGGSAQRDILDSPIGESGVALSGGQRQRLSLARAILHHPKVLVMDEPTASLDGIAESQINELIDRTMKGVTTVYSAHRLSLILAADWIVVIRDGKMLREGTHEDLMCSCPYYASLIAAQQGRKTV